MASDGRLVGRGLLLSCLRCGLVRHGPPRAEELRRLFESDYGLYAHPPGLGQETLRQQLYARWICAALGGGCTGSVLSSEPEQLADAGTRGASSAGPVRRHQPSPEAVLSSGRRLNVTWASPKILR
jgi:hypothetical protein